MTSQSCSPPGLVTLHDASGGPAGILDLAVMDHGVAAVVLVLRAAIETRYPEADRPIQVRAVLARCATDTPVDTLRRMTSVRMPEHHAWQILRATEGVLNRMPMRAAYEAAVLEAEQPYAIG